MNETQSADTHKVHLARKWIAAGLSIAFINAGFSLDSNVEL